jgi:hypothetical protein
MARRYLPFILCAFSICAGVAKAQSSPIEPLRATAGTVLTFYLQTRMAPGSVNSLDALPKGTILRVRLLDSVDSSVDRDGAEFHGALAAPVFSEDHQVLLHPDAQVRGLFVVLRSRNHPEGFRYELLATSLSENGKSYVLTASLNSSFSDSAKRPPPSPAINAVRIRKDPSAETVKIQENQ